MIKIAKTHFGNFLGYSQDYLFQQIERNEFHDPDIGEFIQKNITKNHNCIDIGANIGAITVFLSKHCGKLYAIEPQNNIYLALCGNLFINECYNVVPLNIAAYRDNKKFSIASKERLDEWVGDIDKGIEGIKSFGSISVEENESGNIDGRKLDDIVTEKIDFIKCDAEGGDLDALMGCERIIKENSPKIIFEFHPQCTKKCYGRTWQDYENFFTAIKYKLERISDSNYLATKI